MFQLRRIFVLLLIAAGIAYAQSAGTAGNNAGSPSSTSVAAVANAKGGEQADSVENQQLRQLPINRRNFLDFTFLTPSVADSHMILGTGTNDFRVWQARQSGLSFQGGNGRGNNVSVDGGEANDDFGGVRLTLGQDAVQEFQVERSNFGAPTGASSGAFLNVVSKSGSNQPHGSVFGFFRNDALDAQDPFALGFALQPGLAPGTLFDPAQADAQAAASKLSLSRQQFGGSIGGPIVKDKTFFFASYEGMRGNGDVSAPTLANTSMFRPTTGQQAIIDGLATEPGNPPVPCLTGQPALPAATCAGILANILTIDPSTSPLNSFIVNQFQQNSGIFPFTGASDLASFRLDHRVSHRNQLNVRYSFGRDNEENSNLGALTTFSASDQVKDWDSTLRAAWAYNISSSTANEASFQWSDSKLQSVPNDPGGPAINIAGYGMFGRNINSPTTAHQHHYDFADNLTWVRGQHTVQVGGSILLRQDKNNVQSYSSGLFSFGELDGGVLSPCLQVPAACGLTEDPATLTALNNISLGLPESYQQGFATDPFISYTSHLFGGFVQDSWKIRSNFTLVVGARYEVDGGHSPLNTDTNNIAPRVSFAWDPLNDHKTVVRVSYGMFYSPVYAQMDYAAQALSSVDGVRQVPMLMVPLNGIAGNPSLTSAAIFQTLFAQGRVQGCGSTGAACIRPSDMTQFGLTTSGSGTPSLDSALYGVDPNFQNPYSEQAQFSIEREIVPGFSASAGYVHTHTLHLPTSTDVNLLSAPLVATGPDGNLIQNWSGTCSGNPCFVDTNLTQNNLFTSSASAWYDAGIFQVNKRFSHHFSVLANYTFSKAINNVTDYNPELAAFDQLNLAADRSLADFDQRHQFTVASVIESPWHGGSGASWGSRIMSGFSVSPVVRATSGHPFNLLAGTDVNNDNNVFTDRPAGASRDSGTGPNFWTMDLRLGKAFDFGERGKLQLVAEGFNIFNRTNYSGIDNFVGDIGGPFNLTGTTAALPNQPLAFNSTNPKRQLQLGLRFDF